MIESSTCSARRPSVEVPASGEATFVQERPWLDPQLWGIGGEYGSPVLYDLVTEVSVDGEVVDQHIQPFDFREFWITGTDFYLNGKRIFIQADLGHGKNNLRRFNQVYFPVLRDHHINTIRNHHSEFWSPELFRQCDQMGMLAYAQMYPALFPEKAVPVSSPGPHEFISVEDWMNHPQHHTNLDNYRRWVKMVRNHPSVVILSTDNEIFTQSWDYPHAIDLNVRNDRIGAIYGRFVQELAPDHVVTRDGDVGTWGWHSVWSEEPLPTTANYHYPEFNADQTLKNWQSLYGFRPLIIGESLYCSYGAWDNWIGPIPSQVEKKAERLRQAGHRHVPGASNPRGGVHGAGA